ncbi:hypothetical protein [Amycolatopsis sp. CFH S0078]|uniref:hypothetical protein n=1 Tax=Amycolatopsis sp. CFH S0078 TaxID=1644108 RepID=UPI00106EE0B6|nr:hypothetical protein [Amycolatopsis sp. CFH S0078]
MTSRNADDLVAADETALTPIERLQADLLKVFHDYEREIDRQRREWSRRMAKARRAGEEFESDHEREVEP